MFERHLLVKMREILSRQDQKRMQRVINPTGVILHTNLGRAPLGEKVVSELVPLMTGYTNLEMNLELDYLVNCMDNDTWKKAGSRNSSFEKQDMWKAQVVFAYSF